jgi:3-hydroxybutyryl-CoA dehydratase
MTPPSTSPDARSTPTDTKPDFEDARAFAQSVVDTFADVTGDHNYLHKAGQPSYDPFPGPIVPGALIMGHFAKILGTQFPGAGTVYLGQELKFKAPLLVGQRARFTVRVQRRHETKPILWLETRCLDAEDPSKVFCEGVAVVQANH